nr:hypothetical protein [Armatimonas sp.]
MIVVACVQIDRNAYKHTISEDFLTKDTLEVGILSFAEDFSRNKNTIRILLLDNKSSSGLPIGNLVSPKYHELFAYDAVFFENEIQMKAKSNCGEDPNSKAPCSCSAILHEFLRQLSTDFPDEQEIYLIIYRACFSNVKNYLDKWEETSDARPTQIHSTIGIYGYDHTEVWKVFSASR